MLEKLKKIKKNNKKLKEEKDLEKQKIIKQILFSVFIDLTNSLVDEIIEKRIQNKESEYIYLIKKEMEQIKKIISIEECQYFENLFESKINQLKDVLIKNSSKIEDLINQYNHYEPIFIIRKVKDYLNLYVESIKKIDLNHEFLLTIKSEKDELKEMSNIQIENIKKIVKNSPFSKSGLTMNYELDKIFKILDSYTNNYKDEDECIEYLKKTGIEFNNSDLYILDFFKKEIKENSIPVWQRNNDKWNQKMQISFIENIIKRATTNIIIGQISLTNEPTGKGVILDGLQRITAIQDFVNNKFNIFKSEENLEGFNYITLKNNKLIESKNFLITILSFNSEEEMVKYYIDINENITHSTEDIQKAKKYLALIENKKFDKIKKTVDNEVNL